MQTVDLGETVPLLSYWWDENGDGAEPSAIALTIVAPDGTSIVKHKADLTSVKVAPEVLDTWLYAQTGNQSGVWRYTYSGTVGFEAEQSGLFLVGEDLSSDGPCEQWCTWSDVEALCPSVDFAALTLGQRESLLDLSTDILYLLDGRHYPGICTTTREVCRGCVTCRATPCACHGRGGRPGVDLGRMWPVLGVWDVVVDGVTLPVSAYTVRDRRYLMRLDGESWPLVFDASWAFGRRPPKVLVDAAAVFAAEMAKSCVGVTCELPQRVTSINREGVTYTILDSQKFIEEGRVGIYKVDLALAAAKAGRKARPGGHAPYGGGVSTSRVG